MILKKDLFPFIIGIILSIILLLVIITTEKEKKFNQINIDTSNIVFNFTKNRYIDTIIFVGLKELNINGINVLVQTLSTGTKEKTKEFGELKAHIHELEGEYYIFIDDLSRDETLTVLSHELIHLSQYYTNDLILIDSEKFIWKKDTFNLSNLDYNERPFEIDAFKKQYELKKKIEKILYNEN